MAPLPKKKLSRARSGKRAAAKAYQPPILVACPKCGNLKTNHTLCPSCGFYKEHLIFEPKRPTKVSKVKEQ